MFVLPGIVLGVMAGSAADLTSLAWRILAGLLSVGLIASSNYTLNEILDAPFDRHHPTKSLRPIPSGQVSLPLAYVQWVVLMAAGMVLAFSISNPFALTMAALWAMGICYNVPPLRTKDVPYLDVLSESINNPIRMMAGWYITSTPKTPPGSLIVSYWMAGAFFMAVKRFAEYREIGNPHVSASYRKSFRYYDEPRLLVSIMFYASFAMLTFGAFIVRYRMEMVLAFPFIAVVMALYLMLAFKPNSAVQNPEFLYREPRLMIAVILCTLALAGGALVDIPILHDILSPQFSGISPSGL